MLGLQCLSTRIFSAEEYLEADFKVVCPPYNAPRYNADSGITRSTVAPEN